MNVLILGTGPEEEDWGHWFLNHAEYHLAALCPGLSGADFQDVRITDDFDAALATAGLSLVIVGGPVDARGEALRRAAAEGLAIICLHPPGLDSEAYYQVALSRSETGAVVVPYLPLRLHPGVASLRMAMSTGELGALRSIRHEYSADSSAGDLARSEFPRAVDVVRSLVGEIEALTASGDPPGERPDTELVVQLRAPAGRRAEVRISVATRSEPPRLTLSGSNGSLTLEYDPRFLFPARLIRSAGASTHDRIDELESWDAHEAIIETVLSRLNQRDEDRRPSQGPTLQDGTRAMELSEAVVRSLRRGRTIDLHYESISEESSFKSIMTSTGCMILLGALLILPLALAGPALGVNGTIYIAYIIPPLLIAFAAIQILRFGIRSNKDSHSNQ
jgi:myo-inositol 2-dehydrogenase/D-chiro-inositol 1-dehydrogenase